MVMPYTITLIPAKPLHNHDIVSVHFNHFYYMGMCDKLSRHLAMLTYIYLNVDECGLTSSMPQQRFKRQICLNVTKCVFLECVIVKDSFDVVMANTNLLIPYKHK